MSASFTAGPWEARDGSLHRKHWLIDAPGRRFIATIDGPPDEEGEANARLIAAAPELLEALADLLCYHDVPGPVDAPLKPLIDAAFAALAKTVQP